MIENGTWSAAGVKSGPFLKDLCFAIAGRMSKSVALTNYRRISQKGKLDLPVAHNRLAAAFLAPLKSHVASILDFPTDEKYPFSEKMHRQATDKAGIANTRLSLLKILEDIVGRKPSIIVSQIPVDKWHQVIG